MDIDRQKIHTYTYTHTYIYTHTHMHTNTCTHTHIHDAINGELTGSNKHDIVVVADPMDLPVNGNLCELGAEETNTTHTIRCQWRPF